MSDGIWRRAAAVVVCLGVVLAAADRPRAMPQSGRLLDLPLAGEDREASLAAGESHDWQFDLADGEYIELVLEPVGLVLADSPEMPGVTVRGPGDALVFDSSEANLTLSIDIGPQIIVSLIAGRAGPHRMHVAARHLTAFRQRYRLRLERRGFATGDDRRRLDAHRLSREATRLYLQGTADAKRASIEKYEAALAVFREVGDTGGEATAHGTIATVWYSLSDPARAREATERALAIWKRLDRTREAAIALSDLGVVAYLGYDHPLAKRHYEEALPMHRAAHDGVAEATTLVRLGWLHFAAGEMSRVIEINQQALPLWRAAGASGGESVSHNDLGRAYADLGDASQALDAYKEAFKARSTEQNPRGAGVVLLRMGQVYLSVADWQPAFDALQQSLALVRRAHDTRNEAAVLSNLGLAYSRIGDSEAALRHLEPALDLSRQARIRNVEANVLAALGVEAYLRGALADSRTYFEQALAIHTAITDVRGQAATLRYLATTQLALGLPRDALDSITQSLAKLEAGGTNASALATLATVRDALGDHEAARAIYVRALERARQIRARDQEASVLGLFGRFEAQQGRAVEARDLLAQAITLHESLRGLLADPEQRMAYSSKSVTPYELYIDVLMDLERRSPGAGHAAEAFRTAERARARGLLELLATSNVDLAHGVDANLVARELALRRNLNAKAAIQTALLTKSGDDRRLPALEKEIADLLRAWRDTTTQIRQQSPAYASLAEPQPASAGDAAALLDPKTVLLEFAQGETRSWLFAISSTGLETFELPARDKIEAAARAMHLLLTARQPRRSETAANRQARVRRADLDLAQRSRTLSQLLFAPIADRLRTAWRGRRLAVVATGALEYVPFAALPLPGVARAGAAAVVADHEIVTLPSASSLAFLRREPAKAAPRKLVAIFADPVFAADDPRVRRTPREARHSSATDDTATRSIDTRALEPFADAATRGSLARLPFSRAEAAAVAEQVPASSVLQATDFDATLALATSGRLNGYRIIHFATHGLINTTRPELSGLALSLVDAQGRSRDGFLRLNTIYNLRLSADLVVLSACQTALGKEIAGEGLVGLTRGFMYAGARRVVASLWQVSDSATAELMTRFYAGMLQRHLSPSAALRSAQLGMAADPRWAAPYFWAGFVLQGDWQK